MSVDRTEDERPRGFMCCVKGCPGDHEEAYYMCCTTLSDHIVFAQHEETGRIWSGLASQLPSGYYVLSVQRAIGACERSGGHDFGADPNPDGTPCLRGCGGWYTA